MRSRIREQGLDVYGIGQKKTPEAFRKACKRFIYVENLMAGPERPMPDRTGVIPARPEGAPPAEPAARKEPPKNAIPLVIAAMRAIGGDEDWYSLGQIGQYIVQANPDFDSRTYGSAKLSDLLRKTGRFEVKQGQGNHQLARDLA